MNKRLKIGLIIAGIVIVGIFTVILKQYYDNTYVGSDYYLQVPSNQDTTIDEWQSNNYTIRGKQYKFMAYNENGEEKIVDFDITDDSKAIESKEQLLQPNTYIKVNASKNRVITWKIVQKQDIPDTVLNVINEKHI